MNSVVVMLYGVLASLDNIVVVVDFVTAALALVLLSASAVVIEDLFAVVDRRLCNFDDPATITVAVNVDAKIVEEVFATIIVVSVFIDSVGANDIAMPFDVLVVSANNSECLDVLMNVSVVAEIPIALFVGAMVDNTVNLISLNVGAAVLDFVMINVVVADVVVSNVALLVAEL